MTTLAPGDGVALWLAGAAHDREDVRSGERRGGSPMILGAVRPSVIAVGDAEWQRSSWFVRLATGGAVVFSVLLPPIRVYYIAVQRAEDGGIGDRAIYAAFAFACYLPVQVWLVLSA